MSKIVLPFLCLFVISSCNNKKTGTATGTDPAKPVATATTQKVTYTSAAWYTGMVEFHFDDETGKDIRVTISHQPEDSGALYPRYLLESPDTLEGPPGANPAMVGKPFLLVKDTAGEVKEIKALN